MKAIKNIRLSEYDYNNNGYYFITICTNYRWPHLVDSNIKNIVVAELVRLNDLEGVRIDYYNIMPNHMHMIIILEDTKYSLFEVIKRFKSKTTIFVKKLANQGWQLQKLWQPNYYEHVIRNENALSKIRKYIRHNPEIEKIELKQFYSRNSEKRPYKRDN